MFNDKAGKVAVIYIRVSSERQVKGYSLEGQKQYLTECATRRGMNVPRVYVEEGKSGKSIEGRTAFQEMLDDIKGGKEQIDYVMVFKLSRFGRNARDVLNSLEFIMNHGVHLMCVEDGLDSSTSMGKMMITILGAVAELERENIIAQTLLGRETKAKKGGWCGGFAPYGYVIENDKLVTVPEEKEVVQLIFDKYLNEGMGYAGVATYLNKQGYKRRAAPNQKDFKFDDWTTEHIKQILSHPIYKGKMVWGRRRTEKVPGTENEYRQVWQEDYTVSDDYTHEAFVSEADFDKIQALRAKAAKWGNFELGQSKAHLLSGILKCPTCGSSMYIDTNQWINKDGTKRLTYSYVCSHYKKTSGSGRCERNGVSAVEVEREVIEFVSKLMHNERFAEDIREKLLKALDTDEIKAELEHHKGQLKKLRYNQKTLEQSLDQMDFEDKNAWRKREEKERRLDSIYDEIYETEDKIEECENRLQKSKQDAVSLEVVLELLDSFEDIYDTMSSKEKRELMKALVSEIHLLPSKEQKEKQRFIKSMIFNFPIDRSVLDCLRVSNQGVECVVLMSKVQK